MTRRRKLAALMTTGMATMMIGATSIVTLAPTTAMSLRIGCGGWVHSTAHYHKSSYGAYHYGYAHHLHCPGYTNGGTWH